MSRQAMTCQACYMPHDGACKNTSVMLSKRMRAAAVADGDRMPNYYYFPEARNFADEVEALEKQLTKK